MAKEEIYTIPLWDAVRSDDECPFCHIENKLEKDALNYCLSDAYMHSNFRIITNAIGFCRNHYTKLYQSSNKLGLVLINQSYTMEMMERFKKAAANAAPIKKGLFKKQASTNTPMDDLLNTLENECYICNRINETMDRYYDTFFYLYKKDNEFIEKINETKGFCMPHYLKLLKTGQTKASPKVFTQFMEQTLPIFEANMNRVLDDMQWFVNKYDYRYDNEPWKDAKDAPKRSVQKINGTVLE